MKNNNNKIIIIIILSELYNRSIWPVDWTLTGTITPCQSGPGSNGYKGELFTNQSSRIGVSTLDAVSYPEHPFFGVGGKILNPCRRYSQRILSSADGIGTCLRTNPCLDSGTVIFINGYFVVKEGHFQRRK